MIARFSLSISAEPTCEYSLHRRPVFPRYSLGRRRVCKVELHGNKKFTLKQQKYRVSEALKTGEANVLFGAPVLSIIVLYLIACYRPPSRDFGIRHDTSANLPLVDGTLITLWFTYTQLPQRQCSTRLPTSDYLADSVDAFLTSNEESESPRSPDTINNESRAIPLGLTFSFPVEQTALDKGFLLTWTKGFSAKNAINKDVVKLLQDAFDRKHLHVKCVALVNDVSLLLFPYFQRRVSMLICWDPDSRYGSFSRIHCRRMRSWCHIWHGHERRVPRTSGQHHQAWERPRSCDGRCNDGKHGMGRV